LLPAKRRTELTSLLTNTGLHPHKIASVKQTTQHSPFRIMVAGITEKKEKIQEEEISIKNEMQQYTEQFVALLKDYYLHL
jgi:tRNA1Val (adenine37-N6)-methyltransferase